MAGGKLTPRQKMINMMYLVLTALLAMNISKEVMNSFAILDSGMRKSNEAFAVKNEITYNAFELALLNDRKKVQKYYDHAKAVKERCKQMYDEIEQLKREIIVEEEASDKAVIETKSGKDSSVNIVEDVIYMQNKDDNSKPTHYMMGESDQAATPDTRAFKLKEDIKKFKEDLLTHIDPKDRQNIRLGLDIGNVYSSHEGKEITWESNTFYHNPAIAVIALMTKMQNDVKNAETDIISSLYNRIDVNSFKFDTLSGRVNANSNYVLIGDEYKAEIFVAGFSTTSNPQIWLGNFDSITGKPLGPIDSTSVKVDRGVGIYTISPSTEGTTDYKGIIRMKNPADPKAPPRVFPFSSQFKSARPAIVVSPDKMNVFYIGLDNPVSISVPGIAAEDLQPSVSGGSLAKTGSGKFNIKVNASAKEAIVNVSAKTKSGTKSMGPGLHFRVKPVPNPVATIYGKRGTDVIKQGELQFLKSVVPMLDNFEFDLKFPVVSFDVSMNVNGIEVTESSNGGTLSEKQSALIKKAHKGNKVYIEKVRVQKPGGQVVDIGSVNLKVI